MYLLNEEVTQAKSFRLRRLCYRQLKLQEDSDDLNVYNSLELVLDGLYYSYGSPKMSLATFCSEINLPVGAYCGRGFVKDRDQ